MSLIIDRDLLVLEPSLFVDAAELGTILVSGTDGNVSGTTLTSATANFQDAGVDQGHAIAVDERGLEVLARPSATSLTLSRPRAHDEDPTIPPQAGANQKFTVATFARHIAEAQAWALGALGIDPHDPVKPLDETAIVNADEFGRLVALRTICDVFVIAAARFVDDPSLGQRAEAYRDRLRRAMNSTVVLLDLNGDGVADAARRMSTIALSRT